MLCTECGKQYNVKNAVHKYYIQYVQNAKQIFNVKNAVQKF